MTAYYNENDEYCANWLENLIEAGHIAPGVVDRRSIEDVTPNDLTGFTQCHFFAVIGVWSYALRRAGWPDDREVWTGSCPCQPFSTAGKSGGFDDERHLWPAWFHLIEICRPSNIFGEQVASKDGLNWLDLVQADLEATGYACGPVDICAAGVGAPHIRQRLYFTAERLGNNNNKGLEGQRNGYSEAERHGQGSVRSTTQAGEFGRVADANKGATGKPGNNGATESERGEHGADIDNSGRHGGMDNSLCRRYESKDKEICSGRVGTELSNGSSRTSPTNGFWGAADWLCCRDGKWRPVEPGTFPLAHGATARVGRLRSYGNAIVAQCAEEVIRAYLEVEAERHSIEDLL